MLISIFLLVNLSFEFTTSFRIMQVSDSEISDECISSFRSGAFDKHNQLRDIHGVAPLSLDSNLNNIAQDYSQKLVSIGSLVHSGTEGLGENLAMAMSSAPFNQSPDECYKIGQAVSQDWYDEITDYNFNNPGSNMNTGHFTQIVWKDLTNVGFGLGFSNDGESYFVVANYSPPGNVDGDFENNVLPPI